ncbi:serine/threonine-protein kinase RIO2-like isoform X2 [Dinothrombium tinctorium]|uniref:Serine/threonine-protein kinase RIO2 n=1 Tax=Dinothrombium tinctorium TaxID=1965070 RepID=A0A443QTP4_9ACAR|nr:serine/threonine-protein kinase RIO2-like isoform X2 [Dinothrombium tinctorium]
MVKLDVSLLRYLTADDIRVLTAVEMGLKNHQLVPASLVATISSLRSGVSKILHSLCRHKLLSYERGKRYDGFRLTYKGYDYLALNVLKNRAVITQIGTQIGVGKESDVFVAINDSEERFALKIHRLGRTCFRKVNDKRDYHKNGAKVHSFLYLSRLAAKREFAFLTALYEKGFPVPKPVDYNRHCVVMQLIDGTLLNHLSAEEIVDIPSLYDKLMNLIIKLANECGVVHGDMNEFNLMITSDNDPILIDFPQMVGTDHKLAEEYFDRDVNCIVDFFKKKFDYVSDYIPSLSKDIDAKDVSSFININNEESEDDEDEAIGGENDENDSKIVTMISDLKVESDNDIHNEVDSKHVLAKRLSESSSDFDSHSIISMATTRSGYASTAASTFAPEDIRKRLRQQKEKREKRNQLKQVTRKIKGEANAIQRERKTNAAKIKEDLNVHRVDPF